MSNSQRRYLIRGSHGVISIGLLSAFVLVMNGPLGLPVLVAIIVGATAASAAAGEIRRRFWPEPPPWTDEERVLALPLCSNGATRGLSMRFGAN
jgi:hypothetical protein